MPHKRCPIELQHKVELHILLDQEKLCFLHSQIKADIFLKCENPITESNSRFKKNPHINGYVSCSVMRSGALTLQSVKEHLF
jgi:hypothetical protein